LEVPVRRAIAMVPRPSDVISTIRARYTCFWGAFRSPATAANRTRGRGNLENHIQFHPNAMAWIGFLRNLASPANY
jgi:hypothetical protein